VQLSVKVLVLPEAVWIRTTRRARARDPVLLAIAASSVSNRMQDGVLRPLALLLSFSKAASPARQVDLHSFRNQSHPSGESRFYFKGLGSRRNVLILQSTVFINEDTLSHKYTLYIVNVVVTILWCSEVYIVNVVVTILWCNEVST